MKILRISFVILFILGLVQYAVAQIAPRSDALASWSPVVITSPTTLAPIPDDIDPLCRTYWYILPDAGGYPAYLTLNVNSTTGSTNSGEWRPNIPVTGFYAVEVFIPPHDPINWDCGSPWQVISDTVSAQYTILGASSQVTMTLSQDASSGQWASLGNHYFERGIGGAVQLNDITGEVDFTRTVSFSMARFTWVPTQARQYLPAIYKDYGLTTQVSFESIQTIGIENLARLRFDRDEPVVYRLAGQNNYLNPEAVTFSWQYSGPCGDGVVYEQILLIPPGSWTQDVNGIIPACSGANTLTTRLTSRGVIKEKTLPITIEIGGTLQLLQDHAFDVCHLPSLDDMRVWWEQSPYSAVNIYMGGISFATGCNYSALSRDWIKDVQKIGWGFIPTWVGPQAPCSDLSKRFSFDLDLAYNQGIQEAQLAASKAIQLGLIESTSIKTVIYYDMEGYSYAQNAKDPIVRASCRSAVKEFIRGWDEQLHAYGIKAAVYGGSLSSYMSDWWSISTPPDAVWAAEWYKICDPECAYKYDPNASVFDLKYLNNIYWPEHQRLHQYAGDHTEYWGGRSLNIDSDVADAYLLLPHTLVPKPAGAADQPWVVANPIQDFQLIAADKGWVLYATELKMTEDGGQTWLDRSPAIPAEWRLQQGYFIDQHKGWLLAISEKNRILLHTLDGGLTWQAVALPELNPATPLDLGFSSSEVGFISFRKHTSQAFREGFVLQTKDGGITWTRVDLSLDDPLWDEITTTAQKGSLNKTGNLTTAEQTSWTTPEHGWAKVSNQPCTSGKGNTTNCQPGESIWASHDGGLSWVLIIK